MMKLREKLQETPVVCFKILSISRSLSFSFVVSPFFFIIFTFNKHKRQERKNEVTSKNKNNETTLE